MALVSYREPSGAISDLLSATVSTLWRRIMWQGEANDTQDKQGRPSPSSSKLYGRDDIVNQIVEQIEDYTKSVAILGPPGIGKTAVAKAVIKHDSILRHFGSRIHWVQCRGLLSAKQLIDSIYDALQMDPSKMSSSSLLKDGKEPSIRSLFTDQPSHLLVLDGFDHLWEAFQKDIEQILNDLLDTKDISVMVTIQGSMNLPSALWQLRLAPISLRSAKMMFYSICPPSYRCPSSQVETLLQQIDCYPLAISAVANACNGHKFGLLPSGVSYGPLRLNRTAAQSLDCLDESLSVSVKSPTMQKYSDSTRMLSIISMLPSGVLHSELCALAPSVRIANELAETLTSVSLAYSDPSQRICLLSPIRSYVLKYHQLDERSREAIYHHYFTLAKQGLCRPRDRYFQKAIELLVSNQQNIEAILDDALSHGCIPALEATLQYSSPRCAIQPQIALVKKALLVAQKEKLVPLIAQLFQRHGEMAIAAGSYFEGRDALNGGIEHFQLLDNRLGVAECKLGIAECIWINSNQDGINYVEEVLGEFTKLNHTPGQANCFLKLGQIYIAGGRHADGVMAFDNAYKRFEEAQDSHGMAQSRAAAVMTRGYNRDNSKTLIYSAVQTFQSFGDRDNMAKCLEHLAHVHIHEGNLDGARSGLQSAIDEFAWLGQKLKVAHLQRRLGDLSDHEEAIALYRKAIPQFWDSRFVYAGAECRLDLGRRYIALGRYSDALLSLERARRELINNGTTDWAFRCLRDIIGCLCALGQITEAELTVENNLNELRFNLCKALQLPSSTEVDITIRGGKLAFEVRHMIEDGDANDSGWVSPDVNSDSSGSDTAMPDR